MIEDRHGIVVMSNSLKKKIEYTYKYLDKYEKFVTNKLKEMTNFASKYEFDNTPNKRINELVNSNIIMEGLKLFTKVTPLGLVYLSILGALKKEYLSNYDITKSTTSGYSFDATTYKKQFCNNLVIPIGINNGYTINWDDSD